MSSPLLARFLYVLPVSPLGSRDHIPHEIPQDIAADYEGLITDILSWQPNAPVALRLSPEAHKLWKAFQRSNEKELADGGRLCRLRDWGSKLPGAALRLAGLFHVANNTRELEGNNHLAQNLTSVDNTAKTANTHTGQNGQPQSARSNALAVAVPFGQPHLPVTGPPWFKPRSRVTGEAENFRQTESLNIVNLAGCRLLPHHGVLTIGIWSDLDTLELRSHFKTLGLESLPILHLECPQVPIEYKTRVCPDRIKGESFRGWLHRAEISQAHRLKTKVPA